MKTLFCAVLVCCTCIVFLTCPSQAGIKGELVFRQDGKDLVITGNGYTTRGLFIVQTGWQEKTKEEVVLTYLQVYNKDTVRRSVRRFQVTWRLKNRTKGDRKFTVRKSGAVFLTPDELRTLLQTETKANESQQRPERNK